NFQKILFLLRKFSDLSFSPGDLPVDILKFIAQKLLGRGHILHQHRLHGIDLSVEVIKNRGTFLQGELIFLSLLGQAHDSPNPTYNASFVNSRHRRGRYVGIIGTSAKVIFKNTKIIELSLNTFLPHIKFGKFTRKLAGFRRYIDDLIGVPESVQFILYIPKFQSLHGKARINKCDGLGGKKILSFKHILTENPNRSVKVIHDLCFIPSGEGKHDKRRPLSLAINRDPPKAPYGAVKMSETDIVGFVDYGLRGSWLKSAAKEGKLYPLV